MYRCSLPLTHQLAYSGVTPNQGHLGALSRKGHSRHVREWVGAFVLWVSINRPSQFHEAYLSIYYDSGCGENIKTTDYHDAWFCFPFLIKSFQWVRSAYCEKDVLDRNQVSCLEIHFGNFTLCIMQLIFFYFSSLWMAKLSLSSKDGISPSSSCILFRQRFLNDKLEILCCQHSFYWNTTFQVMGHEEGGRGVWVDKQGDGIYRYIRMGKRGI